jgi:hypothetical protein
MWFFILENVFNCSVQKGSEGGVLHLGLLSCPYTLLQTEHTISQTRSISLPR